jgi:hypothetical protein
MKITLALLGLLCLFSFGEMALADESIQDLRASTYADFPHCQGTMTASETVLAVGDENDFVTAEVYLTDLVHWSNLGRISVASKIVDLKIQNNDIYILTTESVEKWSMTPIAKIASFKLPQQISVKGLAVQGDVAYVALGSNGLGRINFSSQMQFERTAIDETSSVTDLDFLDSKHLVLSLDNTSKDGFQGLAVVNIPEFKVDHKIPLKGAAYPLSVKVNGDNVLLGLFPAIWKFKVSDLLTSKKAKVIFRSWQFPGVTDPSMIGKNFYDSKYMYSCFQSGNQAKPKVFKLSDLNLN